MAEGSADTKKIIVEVEAVLVNKEAIQDELGDLASSRDATPVTERGGRGGKQIVDVEAAGASKLGKSVARDIQGAFNDVKFGIQLNTDHIRQQVEAALRAPFSITINTDVHGAQGVAAVGTQHGAAVITGAPMGRGAPPDDVRSAMWHQGKKGREQYAFVDAIDNVYRNINDALKGAGQRVGTHGVEPGNQAEKLAEMMDRFGNKVSDWVETAGPLGMPTGKGTMVEALKEAGVGMQDPNVQALTANIGGFGGDNKRAAEIFAKRVYDWAQAAPVRAAPAAEQQPTVQARPQATVDPSIQKIIAASEEQTKAAREAVIQERQRALTFTPIGPETIAPFAGPRRVARGRGAGGPLNVDAEAEARAQSQLGGGERANVRRLRGRGGTLGGIELEPFLRAAESGAFQDVFERFAPGKTGVSQGLFKADTDMPEAFDELTRLGKRRPGARFDIAGQEDRFAAVRPGEALKRAFIEATGAPDAAAAFLEENKAEISKAASRGARPLVGVRGETKRGQGAPTLAGARLPRPGGALDDIEQAEVIHTSDASEFSEASRRFDQLKADRRILLGQRRDLRKKIDAANAEEEEKRAADPKKRTTQRAYRRIERLGKADEALASEIAANRVESEELSRREPELRRRRRREAESLRAMDASERARSGPAQREIERGRSEPQAGDKEYVGGRTAAERRDVHLRSPEAQGAIGAHLLTSMGLGNAERGITPTEMIVSALEQNYRANQSRVDSEGRSLKGSQTMRQAAFGPTGRARRTINEGEDAGVYGELVGAIPPEFSKSQRASASKSIFELLSSRLEEDKRQRDELEKTIVAKEGLTRGVLPGRTTASAIATDEGIQRVAFDRARTGEGEFLDAPGLAGARDALIARNRQLKADAVAQNTTPEKLLARRVGARGEMGSETPYSDPDSTEGRASVENYLRERQAKDLTRQRTLGRGRVQSGADTEKLAREAGIPMEPGPVPEGLPFAAFSQKYGGGQEVQGGGRGEGGEGEGGDWSRLIGGDGGQAIPVFVTGGRLESIGSMGGGGGGGGGRGRTATAGGSEEGPPPETETYKPATLPSDRKIGAVERAMERDFAAALRGQNDPRAKAAFEKRQYDRDTQYLAGGSPSAAESGFLSALQRANDPRQETAQKRAQEAEAKRQARFNRVANPEGVDTERNVGQDELRGERARLRSVQRRVPRRGFGASLTDLVTSAFGGKAFENQLEAAGRAEVEFADLQSLTNKRSDLRAERTDLRGLRRTLPGEDPRRAPVNERILQLNKQLAGLDRSVDNTRKRFNEFSDEAGKGTTVLKSFGAAAAGSVISTGIGAFTFGLGSVVAAPIIEGIGTVFQSGLEKLLGDPGLKATTRTALGEATRGAAGRAEIGVAQVAGQAGLSDVTLARLSPLLTQAAAIEAGNKALEQQIGIAKLGEETRQRGGAAGVTQTLGGLFGTPIGGQMPAVEQLGNYLGGTNVKRIGEAPFLGFEGLMPKIGPVTDVLVGDLDKLHDRTAFANEALNKVNGNLVEFGDGLKFTREEVDKQIAELQLAGNLTAQAASSLVAGGAAPLVNRDTGQLATGKEALAAITEALEKAAKPDVTTLLRQTADERRAQVWLQNQQRELTLRTVQPQTNAIGWAQQGFGVGGPQTAGAGINLGGLSSSDQKRLNGELGQTQKLYDQINREVDTGIKAAKDFVSAAFPEDATVGMEFAKSLDLAAGYGREIASIQIGVQTKQAAFSAAQFAYQINIAKRSLADARGLAGQITGESKNNLGVLEREQFFLQRRAQMMQLELSQRQINFQRSIAGFTAPGLTGEERAARIQQAKIEADYAQKQLNIQKQLFGLGGKQFTIQASRQVQDLVGQLGLLEKGRVLNVETAVAEKRIKLLTLAQEKENKKVQTFYEAAIARTNDIMTLEAQMVAATGEALTTITTQVINAFRRTYAGIRDVMTGGVDVSGSGSKDTGGRNALGAVGMVNGETSFGPLGVAGEAGGEAYAILRDPQKLMSPLGGGGSTTTIQIVVSGNKFTSEDEEDRVMRKITQAVKDSQDRDFALRGLRN